MIICVKSNAGHQNGVSSLVALLATKIALDFPKKKIVTIDLNVAYVELQRILNCQHKNINCSLYNLASEFEADNSLSDEYFCNYLTKVSDNLYNLNGISTYTNTIIKEDILKQIITRYNNLFDIVIVDSAANLLSNAVSSISDIVINVISPNLNRLESLKAANSLELKPLVNGVYLTLVNLYSNHSNAGVDLNDLKNMLGISEIYSLPYSEEFAYFVNNKNMNGFLEAAEENEDFLKHFDKILEQLYFLMGFSPPINKEKIGFLSKIFKKGR